MNYRTVHVEKDLKQNAGNDFSEIQFIFIIIQVAEYHNDHRRVPNLRYATQKINMNLPVMLLNKTIVCKQNVLQLKT